MTILPIADAVRHATTAVAKARTREDELVKSFDAKRHPRGKNGRFITVGGTVRDAAGNDYKVSSIGPRGDVRTTTGSSLRERTFTPAEAKKLHVVTDGEQPKEKAPENDYRVTGLTNEEARLGTASGRKARHKVGQVLRAADGTEYTVHRYRDDGSLITTNEYGSNVSFTPALASKLQPVEAGTPLPGDRAPTEAERKIISDLERLPQMDHASARELVMGRASPRRKK